MPRINFSARFVGICSILLSACASQPPLPEIQDGWRARGKFSFSSDESRESGNFDWRQSGEEYRVRLYGPLGFGTVQISGNSKEVSLRTSEVEHHSSDPEYLFYETTGMHLPLTDLPAWLRGEPTSFHPEHTEFDGSGRITKAFVQGWEIAYPDYTPDTQLPKEIIANQDDKQLRLIVLAWES